MRDIGRQWLVLAVAAVAILPGNQATAQSPIHDTPLDPAALLPPLPVPAPGGPEHIFYGALPPAPPYVRKPWVLVFIPGLHGTASDWWIGNDMYSRAYARGYRTAFVSMSLDNSPNDAHFDDNAPIVRDALVQIVQHYDTDKVVLIGHSKGGIDAQAALLDASTRELVRAVFTISSPNTGTELADWAFGEGQEIAGQLGLLTPGVESVKTDTMAAFRAQADPVFRASGIPFYTMGGSVVRGHPITAITGLILFEQTGGQKSDGLVPFPRTRLPQDYANDLGEIRTNHFAVDSGRSAFPKLNSRLQALEYTLDQFAMIRAGGHGDRHNSWMWSMEWFKDRLLVGTGREIHCLSILTADNQAQTSLYSWLERSQECPQEHVLADSVGAEIWSFDPASEDWQRVFKSPNEIPLGPIDGHWVATARDVGFRGMTVFREADGTEALYVGGVTSGSAFEDRIIKYTGEYPPPRLMRSVDGVQFEEVPHEPGTFLGEIGNPLPGSTRLLRAFRSLTAYDGKLFATASDFRGVGVIVVSEDPAAGNDAWQLASPIAEEFPVWTLKVFNGFLYATTGDMSFSDDGFGVYKTDASGAPPYVWTPVITDAAFQSEPGVRSPNGLSFAEHHGQLYVGTNRPTELYRINRDDTWDLIVGEPRDTPAGRVRPLSGMGIGFGSWFNGHFWRQASHEGTLYLTTWDASTNVRFIPALDAIFGFQFGFDFFRSDDGVHWEALSRAGMWDTGNIGGRSILSTEAGLFLGTARNKDGGQVFHCKPPACTPDEALPELDRPRMLEAESEEISGRLVELRWLPVPNAVHYRVYRATVLPITTFLPGDLVIEIPLIGSLTLEEILKGALDFLCTPSTPGICDALAALKNPLVGLPTPFVQVGIRTSPFFSQLAPTAYQSLYFVRAEDGDGNLSTPSNFVGAPSKGAPWVEDDTSPVISAIVRPPPNAEAWNNSDVTVSWSVEDPETGIRTTSLCETRRITRETTGLKLTCSATNGKGMASSGSVTVRIDKRLPQAPPRRRPVFDAPRRSAARSAGGPPSAAPGALVQAEGPAAGAARADAAPASFEAAAETGRPQEPLPTPAPRSEPPGVPGGDTRRDGAGVGEEQARAAPAGGGGTPPIAIFVDALAPSERTGRCATDTVESPPSGGPSSERTTRERADDDLSSKGQECR